MLGGLAEAAATQTMLKTSYLLEIEPNEAVFTSNLALGTTADCYSRLHSSARARSTGPW